MFAACTWRQGCCVSSCSRSERRCDGMTKSYPPQLVDAIWEDLDLNEIAQLRLGGGAVDQVIRAEFALRRAMLPPRAAVRRVLDAAFFASLKVEEGVPCRVSAVCGVGGCGALSRHEDGWDVVPLQPEPLSVTALAKLAPLCGVMNSHLVLSFERDDEVFIEGVAIPLTYRWSRRSDHYLRVATPEAGSLVLSTGRDNILQFSAGEVTRLPPKFGVGQEGSPALVSLSRNVFGFETKGFYIAEFFDRIAAGIQRIGHGGLLTVLESPDVPDGLGSELRHRLPAPLAFGPLLKRLDELDAGAEAMMELRYSLVADDLPANAALPANTLREEAEHQRLTAELERRLALLLRFSSVDGAVLMSPALEVLGFGLKVPATTTPYIREVDGYQQEKWPRLDLSKRGTRHRAAAAFASASPERLSLLVSQDHSSAIVTTIGISVVYWPIGRG